MHLGTRLRAYCIKSIVRRKITSASHKRELPGLEEVTAAVHSPLLLRMLAVSGMSKELVQVAQADEQAASSIIKTAPGKTTIPVRRQ